MSKKDFVHCSACDGRLGRCHYCFRVLKDRKMSIFCFERGLKHFCCLLCFKEYLFNKASYMSARVHELSYGVKK